MDTTTLSGISNAATQAAAVSPTKPVARVKAPERSSDSGEQNPSLARNARDTASEASASEKKPLNGEVEKKASFPVEESLIEIVADSFDKGTQLKVDRDDDTGRIIFQTVVKETGEVIRQVPSEEMVSLAKSMNAGKGLLVDKEA